MNILPIDPSLHRKIREIDERSLTLMNNLDAFIDDNNK
jgi:hypothetical protein